jgi:hypothetical protein
MDDVARRPRGAAAADTTGPDRPIFIVACPRSGTTLLQLMISAHPRIAIPPENRFVVEGWMRRQAFGDLRRRKNRVRLARWIFRRRLFKDLELEREPLRRAIAKGPPTIGSAMGIVLREYARSQGKPRWGDKRPVYLKHLDWLLQLFPDAQFIHIVRDGRDCVASLKRMRWWRGGSLTAISRWVESMRQGEHARRSLRPDQYLELQYEHLVANPREELERICAFLGEEFDERMLEHHRSSVGAPKRKTWHARTAGAVTTQAVNQWNEQLEPWELAAVELVGRRYLKHYGYALSGQRRVRPHKLAQAWLEVRRRELGSRRVRRDDLAVAKAYGYPVAAQLTSGQRRVAAERGELFGGDHKGSARMRRERRRRRRAAQAAARPDGGAAKEISR